jgi:hypothetical protein
MNDIDEQCVEWDTNRNLIDFVGIVELKMLQEEIQELADAIANGDEREILDAFCDIRKLATSATKKLGFCPTESMQQMLLEISSRKQCPIQKDIWEKWGADGSKWQKDLSQSSDTLYFADYEKARL